MARQVTGLGLDKLKSWEGKRLQAYRDTNGTPTIGYGHTAGVKMSDAITDAQADAFFLDDLAGASAAVERYVTVPLNDNQFAALVSLVFNIGAGAFAASTLLRLLNAGDYSGALAQFAVWNKETKGGRKVVNDGLVNRRAAEMGLWATGAQVASASVDAAQPPMVLHPAAKYGIGGLTIAGAVEIANQVTPVVQSIGSLPLWLGISVGVVALGVAIYFLFVRKA